MGVGKNPKTEARIDRDRDIYCEARGQKYWCHYGQSICVCSMQSKDLVSGDKSKGTSQVEGEAVGYCCCLPRS